MTVSNRRQELLDLAAVLLYERAITVVEFKTLNRMFGAASTLDNPAIKPNPKSSRRRPARIHRWTFDQIKDTVMLFAEGEDTYRSIVKKLHARFGITVTEDAVKTMITKVKTGYLSTVPKYQTDAYREAIPVWQAFLRNWNDGIDYAMDQIPVEPKSV